MAIAITRIRIKKDKVGKIEIEIEITITGAEVGIDRRCLSNVGWGYDIFIL